MDLEFELVQLDNGLRVLLASAPNSGLAYVEFQTLAGRYFEKYVEAAHFLEHLIGHLTSRAHPSAHEIGREIEDRGLIGNAFVDGYLARYFLNGNASDLDFMTSVLRDVYAAFALDTSIFKQERNAVVAELRDAELDPWVQLQRKVDAILFPDHPASFSYADRIRSARSLTEKQVLYEYKRLYGGPRTLFVVIADESLATLRRNVLPQLESISKPQRGPRFPAVGQTPSLPRVTFARTDGISIAQLQFVYRVPFTAFDARKDALDAICSVLVGGLTSRLYARLRGDKGLAYSVRCEKYLDEHDARLSHVIIASEMSTGAVEQGARMIKEELTRLAKEPITREEQRRLRNRLKVAERKHALGAELGEYAEQYSRGVLFDHEPESFAEKYRAAKVTPKEIQKVSREIFKDEQLLIAYAAERNMTKQLRKLIS